ncbi:MAG: MBL fold metallo-hydrolase [Candidatus Spechtbacterales bacterium]
MEVTVLGSGVCASQLPGVPNRYPPGFLVEWGKDSKVLFECSEGIRFRLEQAGYDYCDIHHIVISHAHPDHFALPHYLQSVFVRGLYLGEKYQNPELHVYCPKPDRG